MKLAVDVDAVDLEAARVIVKEIAVDAQIHEGVEDGGAFDPDAEGRNVGSEGDARPRPLIDVGGEGLDGPGLAAGAGGRGRRTMIEGGEGRKRGVLLADGFGLGRL